MGKMMINVWGQSIPRDEATWFLCFAICDRGILQTDGTGIIGESWILGGLRGAASTCWSRWILSISNRRWIPWTTCYLNRPPFSGCLRSKASKDMPAKPNLQSFGLRGRPFALLPSGCKEVITVPFAFVCTTRFNSSCHWTIPQKQPHEEPLPLY